MKTVDPTKAFYNAHADEFEKNTHSRGRKVLLNRFSAMLPAGGGALDLGCAYGRDSVTFVKKGFKVPGVDFSATLIAKARRRVRPANFLVQDIRRLRLPKASFDGIWATAVLLHLSKKDLPPVLKKLHQLLRRGGTLCVGIYLGKGEGFIKDRRYKGAKKYYSYFTEPEIKKFLQDAKFNILHFEIRPPDSYETHRVVELLARKPLD